MTKVVIHMNGSEGYLSRSWAMLTAEKGWYKPLLMFAAVSCIPVVGQILGGLAFMGYCLEWARLTAWGVDAVPKQRGVKIGELLSSGWRGFCVIFAWSAIAQLVLSALQRALAILHLTALGTLFELALVLVGAFGIVAALRAAVYQKLSAGFGASQLWDMLQRDTRGFMRVTGLRVAGLAIAGTVGSIFSLALLTSNLSDVVNMLEPIIDGVRYDYLSEYEVAEFLKAFFNMFVSMAPMLVLLSFITLAVSFAFTALAYNAAGLWMRQFNVPAWGSPSDPIPADESEGDDLS